MRDQARGVQQASPADNHVATRISRSFRNSADYIKLGSMSDAACALLIKGSEILLGLRASHKKVCPNRWDFIGGQIRKKESPEHALIREVQEEIGVLTTEYSALATIREARPEWGGPTIYHLYLVTRWQGNVTMLGDEHTDLRWFPILDACQLPNLGHPDYPRIFADLPK